jgi:hypothetical protein
MVKKQMASTTQTNVETVQQVYESYNEGDIESVLALMADDVEWTEPEGSVFGGTYHRPTAVLENVFEPSMNEFEAFSVTSDEFIDAGETVVVRGTFHATTKSGQHIESPFAHVVSLQDGHITKFENYTDTALWQ